MPLVSRQNLDYERYWLHYYYFFFTLKCSFYKKGYVTYVVIFSYILYIILVSSICIQLSKKKKSPNTKEKKSRGEIEVCIYESYLRNVFKLPVSAK